MCLFKVEVFELKIQDVRDVPEHGSQLNNRVISVRLEIESKVHVETLIEFLVALEFMSNVIEKVVGLNAEPVVLGLQLLESSLGAVQLVSNLRQVLPQIFVCLA